MDDDTTHLVRAAQEGDTAAFGRLVERFQDRAFAAAYARLGDYHQAQDAAQEAFVEAFINLRRLQSPSAFGAWFQRIIWGKCVRTIRGSKILSPVPLDAARWLATPAPGPVEVAEGKEAEGRVHAALQSLPDGERRATILFYLGGHSYQEIAVLEGVPLSTVKKRLYSARGRLKAVLEEDLPRQRPSDDAAFAERVRRKRSDRTRRAERIQKQKKETIMEVEVRDHTLEDKHVIKNLYTFYRYDLMPFLHEGAGSFVNRYGVLDGERSQTHEEGVRGEDGWWEKPGTLFAFLIRVDGRPVGFTMVARPPHATPGVDYRLNELFVLNKCRRQGVGTRAVTALFDRMRGKWEVAYLPDNEATGGFWRTFVPAYTGGNCEEVMVGMGTGNDDLPGYLFDNSTGT